MKKICVILCIIGLCICNVCLGVRVAAKEGGKMYQQDEDAFVLSNNSFYRTHKKECRRSMHSYLAKKEVTCYKDPESNMKSSTFEKGSALYIVCTYCTNFDTWGLASKNGIDKWVKLRDLEFVEDLNSFIAEYWKEMGKPKNAELKKALETVAGTLQKDIVKWSYPCSGKVVGTCSKKEYPDMRSIYLSDIYRDKQGRYWKIYGGGEFYDMESYAICLSDPENDQIAKEITLTKPYAGGKYSRWLVAIPIGIVICILIVGVIIFRVRRRLRIKNMAEDV